MMETIVFLGNEFSDTCGRCLNLNEFECRHRLATIRLLAFIYYWRLLITLREEMM